MPERFVSARLTASQTCLDAGGPRVVFQPIVELGSRDVVGYEGLARFFDEPLRPGTSGSRRRGRSVWAWPLELAAVRSCPAQVAQVSQGAYASLNVSPSTVASGELASALAGLPTSRIVIEATEHAQIDDWIIGPKVLHRTDGLLLSRT